MSAYNELNESDKRLANKLIIALHNNQISGHAWHAINRTINRARRDPNDTGKLRRDFRNFNLRSVIPHFRVKEK